MALPSIKLGRTARELFFDEQRSSGIEDDDQLRQLWSGLEAGERNKYNGMATAEFTLIEQAKKRKAQVSIVEAVATAVRAKCGKAAKVKCTMQLEFEDGVLEEATKLGYESQLNNLARRPEIVSKYVSARRMMDALKESEGLVNKAKEAILASATC